MIKNVTAAPVMSATNSVSSIKAAAPVDPKAAVQPEKTLPGSKAVPRAAQLNAEAFFQREQIAAALYDRSFTLSEGVSALKRQDAIAAYAEKISAKEGGPTAADLRRLEKRLERAQGQIQRLSTNGRGADLDSVAGIDGRELDIVQENLANRINAGIKQGSLTEEEGEVLRIKHQGINDLETRMRASDSKLTAGEQKQVLDQLRKLADQVNDLRSNSAGTYNPYQAYSDAVDKRQASLEKELQNGLKLSSLTADEAETVRAEFAKVNALEDKTRADGRINWREYTALQSAMNEAEIKLYDLQRNKAGTQRAEQYVDVKYVDMREAQQLEGITRGLSNKKLTEDEGITLLNAQQAIQNHEERFVASGGGLNRSEYLRLQSEMNDFSLLSADLNGNAAKATAILKDPSLVHLVKTGSIGTGGASGGTPAAGAGGSAGGATQGSTPAAIPVASPPPVVSASAAPVAAVAAKPVSEPEKVDQSTQPKPSAGVAAAENLFGKMMAQAMKDLNQKIGDYHAKAVETAREAAGEARQRDEKKPVAGHQDWPDASGFTPASGERHAEKERNVKLYAAIQTNDRAELPMTKKVA